MRRSEATKRIDKRDASKLKIGIVVSRYNEDITTSLLGGAIALCQEWGVKKQNIRVVEVPGGFEIPFGCLKLLQKNKPDAIIALGCIIKGETDHDVYIANAVSYGITQLSLQYKIPIAFGVITTNNLKQAKVRATGSSNKGREAAAAALSCALLK